MLNKARVNSRYQATVLTVLGLLKKSDLAAFSLDLYPMKEDSCFRKNGSGIIIGKKRKNTGL